MDCQFDDLFGRFWYKNQCNTIIATGQTRLTLRVTQESSLLRVDFDRRLSWNSSAARSPQTLGSWPIASWTMFSA